MGNAGGKEDIESGNGGFPREKTGGDVETPRKVVPGSKLSQNNSENSENSEISSDIADKRRIPTLISWYHGGNNVSVEGSWDNWSSRIELNWSGKDFYILLALFSGTYHCKFVVDGELRFAPHLPHTVDFAGYEDNILHVIEHVPENVENISEIESPISPESSYRNTLFSLDDFAKEPPALPPHLPLRIPTDSVSSELSSYGGKPHNVELNHIFAEDEWAQRPFIALYFTHRFKSKYVTITLYKALKV